MKVIFDNNVLISVALLPQSIPFRAFDKAVNNHLILRSHKILNEFRNTIYKSKFDKYFKDDVAKEDFIVSFITISTYIITTHHVNVCRDPKDNMYLELALSGGADVIITGDSDLLVLHPFPNISIISPKEFLDKF
ncbi:MAG TPA: putative toxin-antitoxin system toxin component, PIN family [Bacteroidales bacterium]